MVSDKTQYYSHETKLDKFVVKDIFIFQTNMDLFWINNRCMQPIDNFHLINWKLNKKFIACEKERKLS